MHTTEVDERIEKIKRICEGNSPESNVSLGRYDVDALHFANLTIEPVQTMPHGSIYNVGDLLEVLDSPQVDLEEPDMEEYLNPLPKTKNLPPKRTNRRKG
jgi:hypothetical protein